MASENVKITIQEVNTTTPRGAGASTDIVYIPGLVTADREKTTTTEAFVSTKNTPVLCQDIATFEKHFGTVPYEYSEADKQMYSDFSTFRYDTSYIYAKELLKAGMAVYYEAVVGDASDEDAQERLKIAMDAAEATKNTAEEALASAESEKTAATTAYEEAVAAGTTGEELEALKSEMDDAIAAYEAAQEAYNVANSAYTTAQTNYYKSSAIGYLYQELPNRLTNITDKSEYTVKYLTTGGYPTFRKIVKDSPESNTLSKNLIDAAAAREDCVALIDHIYLPTMNLDVNPLDLGNSLYSAVNSFFASEANGTYGAMFTPWAMYTCPTMLDDATTTDKDETLQYLPASFGYLMCMANAIKTSPNWLAMAGVARGVVPNIQKLAVDQRLSNTIAEEYQPKFGSNSNQKVSINAITDIKPYGLTIWGNRTLHQVAPNGTTALNFLNTRNMISDIKKLAYTTAKSLMFEQDSEVLWLRFKSGISPLLDRLKSGFGISNYKIIKGTTKYDGTPLTRGEISAVIKIYPLYAVEYFEITVVIADEDVTVS